MTKTEFLKLRDELLKRGYEKEIDWQETLKPCEDAKQFLLEYIWVVVNSGMKNQIARKIHRRICTAIEAGTPIAGAFGHKGKVKAIEYGCENFQRLFDGYIQSPCKLEYLKMLPWIGPITKYHLAKNLGEDVVKPDRHLVRIAKRDGTTCFEMCRKLAAETGMRIATVDVIIWRAANLGLV